MTREVVDLSSSALRSASYDEDSERLEIAFTSGSSYTFHGVPRNVFEGLRDSGSPGQYYHQNIKGRYS